MRTRIKPERYKEFCANAFNYGFRRVNQVLCKETNNYHIVIKSTGQIVAWKGSSKITDIDFDIIPALVWDGYVQKYE